MSDIEELASEPDAISASKTSRDVAQQLGEVEEGHVVEPLLADLIELSWAKDALKALRQLETRGVVGPLFPPEKFYADDDVKKIAVDQLEKRGAVRYLCSALGKCYNEKKELLLTILSALFRLNDPCSIDVVLPTLKNRHHEVRNAASKVLSQFNNPRSFIAVVTSGATCDVDWAWEQLRTRRMVSELKAIFGKNMDWDYNLQSPVNIRGKALDILQTFVDEPSVVEFLFGLLSYDDQGGSFHAGSTARSARKILIKLDNPIVLPVVFEAFRKEDSREEAIKAMGSIRDASAISLLLEALNDDCTSYRKEACIALGKVGQPEALEALFRCYNSEEQEHIRPTAASAINDIAKHSLAGVHEDVLRRYADVQDAKLEWGNEWQGGGGARVSFAVLRSAARDELQRRGPPDRSKAPLVNESSDIEFDCPKCQIHIVVEQSGAGMELPCPRCLQKLVIPDVAPDR